MIDDAFFRHNRERLGKEISGGLVVVAGYEAMQQAADMATAFIQEANFWYLSGIERPKWHLVYDGQRQHTWVVRPRLSEVERVFDGSLSDHAVLERSGADEIIDEADFEALLRQLARKHTIAHTVFPIDQSGETMVLNPAQKNLTAMLRRIMPQVIDVRDRLAKMRAIKQPSEIVMMRKAADLTMDAFTHAKEMIAHCRYEYELEAEFTAWFRKKNARHAYEPIVASGANATTLHYIANSSPLRARDMVLLDIGASCGGYASDVTRTYAKRTLTKRHQAVHEAVQSAQVAIIGLLKPGMSVREYHVAVDEIIAAACRSLGLDADNDQLLVRRYMPHAVSHGLGIDVHDPLGRPEVFRPGMVLTVEPGIYLPEEGIGVRIEDDILITESGHQNLTGRLSTDW